MSLFEMGQSTGDVSLLDLLSNKDISSKSPYLIEDISDFLVSGGFPSSIGKILEIKKRQVDGYCKSIINTEISNSDGIARNPEKVEHFLRSYSRHISSQASIKTIVSDIEKNYDSIN